MAPPEDKSRKMEEDSATATSPADNRPISTIVFIFAMQKEAEPLMSRFQLTEDDNSMFPKGVPWVRYYGKYKDLNISIVCPGKDPILGVECVGTVSASLLTYASIQALKPDLIINAGTAGGYKAKGASIGNVFLVSHVTFHDRRIPIPVGKLSTGDSLDMSPADESSLITNDATVKDMEGAAIAYVAELLKVPTIFLKAVTDIMDGEKQTTEVFLQNLTTVTAALDEAAARIVDFINGNSLAEL